MANRESALRVFSVEQLQRLFDALRQAALRGIATSGKAK